MIKIISGKQIDSKQEGRITFEYKVLLFEGIELAYVVFKSLENNKIIIVAPKAINITDHHMHTNLRRMLEHRYLRDVYGIGK